ncbi:MAG: NUDIX hydrolase [Oscillospiraceae bacterium]|jgi:ADP-ribose pyrophosphatase YjhB (NUDIX family)|nr:NUDIX hydrolase [Oscillospiraceae bacterium]
MHIATYYLNDPAAPKPNSPTRLGANVLFEHEGKLLLEQRWDCGAWGLVGGRLRSGERAVHGIARELREETGISLPESAFAYLRTCDEPGRIAAYRDGTVWRMVIVLFAACVQEPPLLKPSRESTQLRFFSREELTMLEIAPTHRDLVAAWIDSAKKTEKA